MTGKLVNQLWYCHTVEYYAAIKKMNYWYVCPHEWISQKLCSVNISIILYESNYMQFQNKHNLSMIIEVRIVVTSGGSIDQEAQKYLLECRKVLYRDLGGGYSDVYKCRISSRFKLSTLCAILLYGHLAWINNDKTHFTIKWIPGSVKEKQLSQLQKFLPRPWTLVKGGAFHQIHQSWHTT